jgi:hypothetical protein
MLLLMFIFTDVQIMNYSENPVSKREIKGEEYADSCHFLLFLLLFDLSFDRIEILVDDLISAFSEAISARPNDPALSSKATMSVATETEAFQRGCALSLQLQQVDSLLLVMFAFFLAFK